MAGFMYFKDSDIVGEATEGSLFDEKSKNPNGKPKEQYYHGWIRINSVRQEVERAIEAGAGGFARARAGTVLKEVEVEKEVDCASMPLVQHCSGGTSFPHVFIHLCTSITIDDQTSLHPYLEFHLFACKVTRYEIDARSEEGAIPTESLSLNFDKIVWRYFAIGPTPDKPETLANEVQYPPRISGWDVLRAKPFDGGNWAQDALGIGG